MRLLLRHVRVPVLALLTRGLLAVARGLWRGVCLRGAVGVRLFAVAGVVVVPGLLRPVRHRRLLAGVPAAVVLRLLVRLLGVRVLLGIRVVRGVLRLLGVGVLLLVRVLLRTVRLLVLLLVRVLLVALLGVRVLRVGLLLAFVLALAVGSLLASPSLVPVQGVLGMPRFGAGAPAILSHRSP